MRIPARALLVTVLLAASALVALSTSDAIDESQRSVLFTRVSWPRTWDRVQRASPVSEVKFIVALKQRNLDKLNEVFESVSDPANKNYQQFLAIGQINAIIAPSRQDRALVKSWLYSHGIRQIRDLSDAFQVTTTVAAAEQLLQTEFHQFTHKQNGKSVIRAVGDISVPLALEQIVEMVAGVSNFAPTRRPPVRTPIEPNLTPDGGVAAIVPQSISALYHTPSYSMQVAQSTTYQGEGVVEFEQQYFSPDDLQAYGEAVGIKIPAVESDHLVGTNDPSNPGVEAELDIQVLSAVSPNVANWFWIEGGETWLYGFATHLYNTENVPLVNSISYGWSEADQCEDGIGGEECGQLGVNSTVYVQRVNTEFQKIGTRGISLICASGDSGANGRTDEYCTEDHLNPDFPGASPYITAVGATQIVDPIFNLSSNPPVCENQGYSCISGGNETAVSYEQASFASGGGFSIVASAPSYQTAAIATYFASKSIAFPPASYFNRQGRGYPDVAAFGSNVLIYTQGSIEPVGGTSASSPIFAGVIALLNEASIKKSGKPLGFLNPLLYQMAAAQSDTFHDITVGNNLCTESGCANTCQGFYATKGWDPVTGLGTPKYENMLNYINSEYSSGKWTM